MKEKKDVVVKVDERFGCDCIDDSTNHKVNQSRRPQGFVEVYEVNDKGEKNLVAKKNLVVYVGREWLAVRAVRQNHGNTTATYNEFLSWIGLGQGGTPAGDPFDPIPPENLDEDLQDPIPINVTDSTCADYRATPVAGYYKHPFELIQFEFDPSNDNKYLIAKITSTLGADDANTENYNQISEAGLYTAEDRNGPFHLFARVTFPAILKDTSRQIIFVWYLYF